VLAYQLTEWNKWPSLREVDAPVAGPGEVVVAVAASGICHSDLHVMSGPPRRWDLPFTLGHETTGWVSELGQGVRGLSVGDPVAIYGCWGCGTCRNCTTTAENMCITKHESAPAGGGLGYNGGMAELMLVPDPRWLVPAPGLDLVQAAPLLDAALTPYHAIMRALPLLRPGSRTVLYGAGGLGHLAIQILRALTATEIVVVDRAQSKLDHARELGVNETYLFEDVDSLVSSIGRRSVDVVFDTVGSDDTVLVSSRVVRPGGHICLIGRAGSLEVAFRKVTAEISVISTFWGTRNELAEVLDLARHGALTAAVEQFALADIAAAYERLEHGEMRGRGVMVPGLG